MLEDDKQRLNCQIIKLIPYGSVFEITHTVVSVASSDLIDSQAGLAE